MTPDDKIKDVGQAVANELRKQRELAKLSKNALAQKAGVSVQSISFIENGVNSPSLSTLLRICGALGIKLEDVLRHAGPNK